MFVSKFTYGNRSLQPSTIVICYLNGLLRNGVGDNNITRLVKYFILQKVLEIVIISHQIELCY